MTDMPREDIKEALIAERMGNLQPNNGHSLGPVVLSPALLSASNVAVKLYTPQDGGD